MNQRQFHLIEKLQVQIAALLAVIVVYALLWPFFEPVDPETPTLLFGTVGVPHAWLFALAVLAVAAVSAAATTHARPAGAVLVTLLGAGGLSLRSEPVWRLLVLRQGDGGVGTLLLWMILETLALAVLALAATLLIALVRGLIARRRPTWVWHSRIEPPVGEGEPGPSLHRRLRESVLITMGWPHEPETGVKEELARGVSCLLMGALVSVLLLGVLMQSTARGQILFALLMSFLLGTLAAHQVFPARVTGLAWVTPMITGIACYLLGMLTTVRTVPLPWTTVPVWARALPIDWLAAGGGGAVAGMWLSARIHEHKQMETEQKQER